jgi:hypothetical membrane protein
LGKIRKTELIEPQSKKKQGVKTCYLLGMAGIIGTILFFLITFSLDLIQPGYNPVLKTISDLVYGSYGWLQNLAFILLGILFFAFVIRLYSMTIRKISSLTGSSLFGMTSIGFFLIAAFPSQTNSFELTLQGLIHNSVTGLIATSFIIGCIAFAIHFRKDPRWKRYWLYTTLTVIFCLTFALLWALIPPEWQLRGLSERLLLISGFIWVSIISIKMVRSCAKSREISVSTPK